MRECACSKTDLHHYRNRLSGPLLDRIDIHVYVPPVPYSDLSTQKEGESSEKIRERVTQTRAIQRQRFRGTGIHTNSAMTAKFLREYCALDEKNSKLLERAVSTLSLSARAYDRILKVARTIADLEGSEKIATAHLAEAIQYRNLDREVSRF